MRICRATKLLSAAIGLIFIWSISACSSSSKGLTALDFAACDLHWSETMKALILSPRATYSESAPEPTEVESARFFDGLSLLSQKLRKEADFVADSELKIRLQAFSLAVDLMSLDLQVNIRSRGTLGISEFNSAYEALTQYCESQGWEN